MRSNRSGSGAVIDGPVASSQYLDDAQAARDKEVKELAAHLAKTDKRAAQLQDQAYAAERRNDEAAFAKLHRQLMAALNEGTLTSQRLQDLRAPAAVERKAADMAKRANGRARLDDLAATKAAEAAADDDEETT